MPVTGTKARAHPNSPRGRNLTFEGVPEDGAPRLNLNPYPPFVNQLSHFYRAWSQITTDRWVLSTVGVGYSIQFCSLPPSRPPSLSSFRDPSHEQLLLQEMRLLLALGVIEEVPQEFKAKGFYS